MGGFPRQPDFSESNTDRYRLYTCLGIDIQLLGQDRALQTLLEAQSQYPKVFALGPPCPKSSSVFFARTHELLEYHFRTVALAFEYAKDCRSRIAGSHRFAHSRDGKRSERSRSVRGVFRPKSLRFSEPRPHRIGVYVPAKLLGSLAIGRTELLIFWILGRVTNKDLPMSRVRVDVVVFFRSAAPASLYLAGAS
jgi:hypothetical protein